MIRLAPGTRKYLLTDPAVIRRNTERAGDGGPVVVVVEAIEEEGAPVAYKRFIAYGALTNGPVTFEYQPRHFVCLDFFPDARREEREVRGAYMTTGEVLLAMEPGEALALPDKPRKSTKGN